MVYFLCGHHGHITTWQTRLGWQVMAQVGGGVSVIKHHGLSR